MAQQVIDVGGQPNDGTGESIRDAFVKVNENFTEVYNELITGNANAFVNSLGVGTAAPGVVGRIHASDDIVKFYSDRRLKTNVEPITNALEKVKSLNGVTYNANELAQQFGYTSQEKLVGLFADEVENVLPEAVKPAPFDTDENGQSKSGDHYKTVQYEKLIPLLVEAIKEQQKLIEHLLKK